jgi:Protein of unknown function (DUF4232)
MNAQRTGTTAGRRTVIALATGALALGVVGFAVPSASGATGATAQCSTADLAAQLKAGSPGAGQRYATIVLTNTSGRTCTVGGYGGLALLGAPGQGVPTDLRRAPSPAPTTVTLGPGASARSLLHWTVIQAVDEGATCEPTAVTVVVTPPNQTTAALQPWTFGPVCQHGRIDQNAYVAGSAAF